MITNVEASFMAPSPQYHQPPFMSPAQPPATVPSPCGLFITVEGVDGCGKSTQAQLLATALQDMGFRVLLTKNPGATPLGAQLRQLLLDPATIIDHRAEMLLYVADRAQHWYQTILPTLQAGGVVVCDRFIDSTIAYQGHGRGQDVNWITTLHQQVLTNTVRSYWPDLTLWYDAPLEVCLQRIRTRNQQKDRLEQEPLTFYEKVADGFAQQAQLHPHRIIRVVAEGSPQAVHTASLACVQQNMPVVH
jgi:dTMP kinase